MSSDTLILNQSTRSVLLPSTMFDQAAIISSSGSDVGFPIANLQEPQPKRKWHHSPGGDPIATHFVVDLGASVPGRQWNCAMPLFHNGFSDQGTNRWRVRTGDTTSGTGFYDSDWMPLWQSPTIISGSPNNPESPSFYRTRGLGAHSHFILPRQAISGEVMGGFLQFRGGSVGFGDVLDQDSIDSGEVMHIAFRVRYNQGFNSLATVMQKGISDVLTGATSSSGGYSVAIRQNQFGATSIVATYNDGTDITICDSSDGGGPGLLHPGWNDAVVTIATTFGGAIQVWLNGNLAHSEPLVGTATQSSASPLAWGQNSAGGQVAEDLDLERVLFVGSVGNVFDEFFNSDLRQIAIPSSWNAYAVYPNDAGLGSTIEDIHTSGFDGTISNEVLWGNTGSTPGTPNLLFNRYARFDFESTNTPTWTMGRFFMGRALEPIVPYPAALPTPLGTPPKSQVTWPMRMTREQFEFIAYALAADTGNAPEVLESWGHDIHLIEGGKTVASVNHIEAEFPWQRQQGTVYGYIQSLDEVRKLNTGLIEAQLTIRGM